jgi:hypothetical protein
VENDHDEEVERVREWIDRLGAFASSLDAIEGDSATDFADNALEAWQHLALPSVTGVTLPALASKFHDAVCPLVRWWHCASALSGQGWLPAL